MFPKQGKSAAVIIALGDLSTTKFNALGLLNDTNPAVSKAKVKQ